MKKYILIIILSVIFTSCFRNYQIESGRVITNCITDEYNIKAYYTSFNDMPIFNDSVDQYVENQKDTLKKYAAELAELKNDTGAEWTCSLTISDTVFMANELYISTRLMNYSFTGGAHGNTTFQSFNYDVKNQKMLDNADILKLSDSTMINNLLVEYFDNSEGCFTEEPSLDKKYTLNISEKGLVFMFWQYELGAYVCGYKEVLIPTDRVKDLIMIKLPTTTL